MKFLLVSFAPASPRVNAAVLANPPEVNRDKRDGRQRQDHAVQHVKSQQGVGVHSVAAEHQKANFGAEHRHRRAHVRAHRDRPERQLIPGQQVAGVAEQQGEEQQHHADHPVEFARRTIRSAVEHAEHVREHQEHHGVRRPAVQVAQKHSRGHHELQVLHVGVGLRHRRMVVQHQQDSGDHQDQEGPQVSVPRIPGDAEVQRPLPDLAENRCRKTFCWMASARAGCRPVPLRKMERQTRVSRRFASCSEVFAITDLTNAATTAERRGPPSGRLRR